MWFVGGFPVLFFCVFDTPVVCCVSKGLWGVVVGWGCVGWGLRVSCSFAAAERFRPGFFRFGVGFGVC
ncbi:hypothetical protein JS531_09570, partial [Bifidobacterium sp. CP2]|uniref:hypothetical protein n=1 Tax=Bifidobacterium sp. CP2 TaxID=2809025 RepID=UPI001BDC5E4A